MTTHHASFDLATPEDTAQMAALLGATLQTGDTVLLSGPVGAGKTHIDRHLIQSLLTVPEDVPSPTFTLVQTYDTNAGTLWHADLYRIGSVHEIEELGLTEAFEQAICLIEWPDRLGPLEPASALSLSFSDGASEDTRHLTATWTNLRWAEPLEHLGRVS